MNVIYTAIATAVDFMNDYDDILTAAIRMTVGLLTIAALSSAGAWAVWQGIEQDNADIQERRLFGAECVQETPATATGYILTFPKEGGAE